MSVFIVNVQDGRVATRRQLSSAGLVDEHGDAGSPWHPIQGSSDASTMWYAVMRKRDRGIFIGTLCFRHGDRRASLIDAGWEEVPVEAIGVQRAEAAAAPAPGAPDGVRR